MGLKKNYCFNFNSYYQAITIIKNCKEYNIFPILYVKYYLINGLGIEWLKELREMLRKETAVKNFQLSVDVKKNYGLFITLVEEKIDFINVVADKDTLFKLKNIAKSNKVLINQNFSIVDSSKAKNIILKIKKLKNT
jgi:hypothetical protein